MSKLWGWISSDLGRRLQRVFSAQMLNQFATIAVQLGLVPILLVAWGKTTYGLWLLLSAVPSYLTFSDFGFTFIAKNEMLIHTSAGRREEALKVFHSVFALLNIVMPALVVVAAALLFTVNPTSYMRLGGLPIGEARDVMALLLLNVMGYQYFLLICGGVRCENRLASEATWGACSRLGEGFAVGLTAVFGGSLVEAALATLANRVAFSIALYIWVRRTTPWLYLSHRLAQWTEIRRLSSPALAFMLLPVSQALLIQGPVIVIGALLGPIGVVTFSTTRTLTRLGTAVANMINGTLQGEYGVAFAKSDAAGLQRIFRYHQLLSLALILTYGLFLYGLKGELMKVYTHGKVSVVEPFFTLMIFTIAAEILWSSISTPLETLNRHVSLAHALVVICVADVILCYFLTRQFGLTGTAVALLAAHLATVATSFGLRHNIRLPQAPTPAALRP